MPELLLVNPRHLGGAKKRKTVRRKKPVAKKRRSAAQKAATRKLVALNKRRRRNPVTAKRRPKARKKPARRTPSRRARRAPARRRRRKGYGRNPALTMRSVQNQLMEAGTGAVGALGLDVIQGYLPIPANLKGGIVGTGVKALLAIGMGVVASNIKMVRGTTANRMVNGALTVVLHDELKKLTAQFAPGLQLGEYLSDDNGLGYAGSGYNAGYMDEDMPGMGSYLPELDVSMEQDGFGEYLSEPDYIDDLNFSNG